MSRGDFRRLQRCRRNKKDRQRLQDGQTQRQKKVNEDEKETQQQHRDVVVVVIHKLICQFSALLVKGRICDIKKFNLLFCYPFVVVCLSFIFCAAKKQTETFYPNLMIVLGLMLQNLLSLFTPI